MCFCFVSPSGLPVCPELVREHIPKTKDVGHFLSVTGTVIRTSLVKILELPMNMGKGQGLYSVILQAPGEE